MRNEEPPGRHGAYVCEVCLDGDEGPHPATHLVVFPNGADFLACPKRAYQSLPSGSAIFVIHD